MECFHKTYWFCIEIVEANNFMVEMAKKMPNFWPNIDKIYAHFYPDYCKYISNFKNSNNTLQLN